MRRTFLVGAMLGSVSHSASVTFLRLTMTFLAFTSIRRCESTFQKKLKGGVRFDCETLYETMISVKGKGFLNTPDAGAEGSRRGSEYPSRCELGGSLRPRGRVR